MFLLEGVLQSLISWLIAVPISLIIAPWFAAYLGRTLFGANLEYRYSFQAALIWLAIILVIGALSSVAPARSATKVSVRQSLAYE
jgi:putative ABC transport system permease protein